MKQKFPPAVYFAMKDAGYSNVAIGELLGVSEAAVRRGLKGHTPTAPALPVQQFVITVTPVA